MSAPAATRPSADLAIEAWLAALRADEALSRALRHHRVLPAREPECAAGPLPGFEALEPVLAARGIPALYAHQARAIEAIERGEDVVLATPTASGKTLVYNLPVLRRALDDPKSRALYLFPLKALEQDQRKGLERDIAALGVAGIEVAVYDGDTPQSRRRKIRANPPQVLITTPDMLHLGILPHHGSWQAFFSGLRTVVIDELHSYRGVFGAHVAWVLRRLGRVAAFHGSRPQMVAASATIANPGELSQTLCGRPCQVVQAEAAPRTRRHVVMLNPGGSAYTAAARLFRLSLGQGLRTIVFTKARKITELIHTWVVEAEPELAARISSYRAGFLPEERREIEARLFRGDLLGVISTSALEMGIDVGGLDVCILVGYPGSQMATWQRSGRVGRVRDAAIALIAQPDALDQYLIKHPSEFFDRHFEHAVCDPGNPEILAAHLPCAAAEVPLRRGEDWLGEEAVARALAAAEDAGELLQSESGREWFAARRNPHREVDLRAAGSSYVIRSGGGGASDAGERSRVIGSIGAGRVFAECHEGAIYLHRGRQYLVTQLDCEDHAVHVRPVDAPYYTRALSEKETEVLSRERVRPAGNFRLATGTLRVTTRMTGYEKRRVHGQDLLGSEPLDLPPTSFETDGLWLEIPEEIPRRIEAEGGHPMGGLHATEHAALALVPLFALCDRFDMAGITFRTHPQLKKPAIFLYDAQPGGVGLARSLFERAEALLEATLEMIEGCECEDGCPSCVHSPRCGNGNRPIDKAAAARSLHFLLGHEPLPALEPVDTAPARVAARPEPEPPEAPEDPRARVLYFDLETQRSAADVGGWHNAHLMRMALAVLWDARDERFETFGEGEVDALLERLRAADLVVGFNVRRFDYAVLRGYTDEKLDETLATFDVLEAVHQRLGYRLSLGHLAQTTLGVAKGGDGLQSLEWWRNGEVERVEEYCRRDVALVRDLVDHARRHGHLLFETKRGDRVRLPARWDLDELIERAHAAGG